MGPRGDVDPGCYDAAVRLVLIVLVTCVLSGCGRVGFDVGGAGDGNQGDGGPADGDGSVLVDSAFDAATVVVVDAPGGGTVFRITATADTALNSAATALNYGGLGAMNIRTSMVSTFVGLVRFDLTPLAGRTVNSATLELRTTSAAFSGATATRVFAVLEPWTEGAEAGGIGISNHAMRTASQAWTTAGCGIGSRDGTSLGAIQANTPNTTYMVPILSALVETWIDSPVVNSGLALVADTAGPSETAGFVSREGGDGAPTLVVIVP